MSLIQVVFGVMSQSDFMCKRCQGGGAEPGAPADVCRMCGGAGMFQIGPCYTYEASEPLPELWSTVAVPPDGKPATVVKHGSDYAGPVKAIHGPIMLPIREYWGA